MGTTLREIIYEIGGGMPRRQGVQGRADRRSFRRLSARGACSTLQIDYDNLIAAGSMMGSGGMIVMDEDNCMVDIARFFLDFTVDESCGKCTPCRIGTRRMLEILQAHLRTARARTAISSSLENLAQNIKDTALCGLGQTAPNPVLSTHAATSAMSTRRTFTRSAVRRATARSCSTTRSIPRSARAAPHVRASARPARSPASRQAQPHSIDVQEVHQVRRLHGEVQVLALSPASDAAKGAYAHHAVGRGNRPSRPIHWRTQSDGR